MKSKTFFIFIRATYLIGFIYSVYLSLNKAHCGYAIILLINRLGLQKYKELANIYCYPYYIECFLSAAFIVNDIFLNIVFIPLTLFLLTRFNKVKIVLIYLHTLQFLFLLLISFAKCGTKITDYTFVYNFIFNVSYIIIYYKSYIDIRNKTIVYSSNL